MIGNAICQYLAGAGLGLTAGANLFSETGNGKKCVVAKTTTTGPYLDQGYSVRKGTFQVILRGYMVEEGNTLAEKIVNKLDACCGIVTANDEEFDIKCINIPSLPILFRHEGVNFHSINGEILYSYTNNGV